MQTMASTQGEIVHETPVYYYYHKNNGSCEEYSKKKSSNTAPKVNNGYCKLNIKVVLKTYDDGNRYYDSLWAYGSFEFQR